MTLKILQSKKNKDCGYNVVLVAELSANHGQSLEVALKSVEAAANAGVDAVKIQTLQPHRITIDSNRPEFKVAGGLWDGQKLIDLYKKAYTPWEWTPHLQEKAQDCEIHLFSSPFDFEAVDFLVANNVPALKIASAEAMDTNFVEYCASKRLPIILSTGMSTKEELLDAKNIILSYGCELVFLHCIAEYPAELIDMNISTITQMQNYLHKNIGLSDHSFSNHASSAAVTLGALMIEKHFSILGADQTLDGPFSLNPQQLKSWVDEVRNFERVIGSPSIGVSEAEAKLKKFRRSLYFVEDIEEGTIVSKDHIASIRPANGLHPKLLKQILNKKIKKSVSKGTPVSWDYFK